MKQVFGRANSPQGPFPLQTRSDPFFYNRRVQLATLATRDALPTIYNVRAYAEAGGLMSYGTSLTEACGQMGAYTARILKGFSADNSALGIAGVILPGQ
jgi:hypothetical protein